MTAQNKTYVIIIKKYYLVRLTILIHFIDPSIHPTTAPKDKKRHLFRFGRKKSKRKET